MGDFVALGGFVLVLLWCPLVWVLGCGLLAVVVVCCGLMLVWVLHDHSGFSLDFDS